MANKGNSRHVKSLSSPLYLGISKKEHKYTAKPMPGRHSLERSLPLISFGKKIGISKSSKYIKKAIAGGSIAVNGKIIRQPYYPVGLNDVVEINGSGDRYIIGINSRGQSDIAKAEGKPLRICKVVQKYKAKGNRMMIRLHDGEIFKAEDNGVKVNDSIAISEAEKNWKVIKLAVGSRCLVIDGVHVGSTGVIEELHAGSALSSGSARIKSGDGGTFETLLDNIMVVE